MNGHTTNGNGTHNRISAASNDVEATSSLPSWPNPETARVFAEIIFACAMGDADDLLQEPSAEALREHFDSEHWIVQNAEQLIRIALERFLEGVDWNAISRHVAAFAAASRSE
jgi:hypothetical protein